MKFEEKYPPLLTARHVSEIVGCHIKTAYAMFNDKRRPVWRQGRTVRMLRDEFLEQLKNEGRPEIGPDKEA